ncbi:hypothetical protein HYT92_01030 [Candidatus Pacearchaeota archaeon]|nr:hypothetical protein [Candidatus Pacearchaeota archaeon]
MKKKISGFTKLLLAVLVIAIAASMVIVSKPEFQNALFADENNSAAGAADNTTARVNRLLASADGLMKGAKSWYHSSNTHGAKEDLAGWEIGAANYNMSLALYRQNEALIELLRQKEDK